MLDVDSRPDIDAGIEKLLNVLPALGVPRSRLTPDDVGVSELIDDENGGMPFQCGVEIKLAAYDAAIGDRQEGQLLQTFEQPLGVGPAVGLDIPDHDVSSTRPHIVCGLEHGVGLAHTGGGTKKNAQASTLGASLFGLDVSEQLIRIGPRFGH